jgi:dTMP kinase
MRVIAFEGIDGSGKTVQAERLAQFLRAAGKRVELLSFPVYESYFGRQIAAYLSGAEGVRADSVDAKSMALWFALDRFAALNNRMFDADILLINRYVLSNAVYQSIRERDHADMLDFVFDLEHEVFGIPRADAYIVFDVDEQNAGQNVMRKGFRAYVGGEGRDVYEEQESIQQRARQKYRDYAQKLDNVFLVPCMENGQLMNEEEIAARVLQVLQTNGLI